MTSPIPRTEHLELGSWTTRQATRNIESRPRSTKIRGTWVRNGSSSMRHGGETRAWRTNSIPSPSFPSPGPVPGRRREQDFSLSDMPITPKGSISAAISSAVVQLMREYTGRGPTKARTYVDEDLITVVLQDTLTMGERSLVRDGEADLVLTSRKAFQRTMSTQMIAAIERHS